MAWLSEEGNEDNVDCDDVVVPNLPPNEESQFEAENEDTVKDNDEPRIVEKDKGSRCGDSVDDALEGTKFVAAVTAPRVHVGTGNTNLTN